MSKRIKPGADIRADNPSKRKLMGRSYGPLVYNDTVKHMVTQKIDTAIKNNRKDKLN